MIAIVAHIAIERNVSAVMIKKFMIASTHSIKPISHNGRMFQNLHGMMKSLTDRFTIRT